MIEIKIKSLEVLNLHRNLVQIAQYLIDGYGLSVITSAYRPGDPGVHGQMPVRGIDFRCRNLTIGKQIEENINNNWQYDPERPEHKVCIGHGEGDNFHIHLQAHRNTKRR